MTTIRLRSAAAVAMAVAAVLGATGTATADGTSTPTGSTPSASAPSTAKPAGTADGARRLCRRVPNIDARIDRALGRLNGPAGERGSIARLQKRVDNAKARNQTAIETYLNDKLTFRKSLVPMLTQRSTDLDAVRSWCDDQGYRSAGAK